MTTKTRLIACLASAAAVGLISDAAMATAQFSPSASPTNQAGVLSRIYGGTWTASGVNFSNGTLTATRLADSGIPTPTSLTGDSQLTSDNIWVGGLRVTVRASDGEEHDNMLFGYIDDTGSDQSFHPLLHTTALGSTATVDLPTAFRWAVQNIGHPEIYTSRREDNVSKGRTYDQLITYHITGGSINDYALMWEDHFHSNGGGLDDAVITMHAAAVPAPAGAGALGLAGIGLMGRRRRR